MGLYNFDGTNRVLNAMSRQSAILTLNPPSDMDLSIDLPLSFNTNAYKNRIWYMADPKMLEELYRKLAYNGSRENNFWGQTASTEGQEVMKLHSGLPRIMVDTMTNVTLSDMRSITFEKATHTELWEAIARENNFKRLLYKALADCLVIGDGAFKISYETILSRYPIIEWYGGDKVDFVYRRGRIVEVVFKTIYSHNGKNYILKERYGYGYIINELYDENNVPVSLSTIPDLDVRNYGFGGAVIDNTGNVKQKGSYMLAVPFIVYNSAKYEGRGESIFDIRESGYLAIDEDLSQWMVTVRSAMPKMLIEEDMIPKDRSGYLLKPNSFDNRFIMTKSKKVEQDNKDGIKMIQFQIMWEAYFQTHVCFLDNVLQGFESPSTIGIDVKKTDNAESQREKEKTTLYTRAAIIDVFSEVLEKLVVAAINSYYGVNNSNELCSEPSINFGEYANPSYEALVETLSKAFMANLISVEWMVEEQWGDSKTPEEKAEEVERIKERLQGGFEIPGFEGDIDYSDEEDLEDVDEEGTEEPETVEDTEQEEDVEE